MTTPQVYVAYPGDKIPDRASIVAFNSGEDQFASSDTAKFCPFTGEPAEKMADRALAVDEAALRGLVQIGTCAKCNHTHRADVASTEALIANDCESFYCVACASPVTVDVALAELAELGGELPETTEDDIDIASLSDAEYTALLDDMMSDAAGLDIAEDTPLDDEDSDDESDDDSEDESEDPELDEEAHNLADTVNIDEEADESVDAPEMSEVEDDAEDADADESEDAEDAVNDDDEPEVEEVDEDADKKPEDSAKLFKPAKDDNKEGKTFAEVMENPLDEDMQSTETASIIELRPALNLATADIACVLDRNASRYFVFANDLPVGTLSRERAHSDNASRFTDEVFPKGFIAQLKAGHDTSRFGFARFTARVDVAGLVKSHEDKKKADIASELASKFDAKLDVIKSSMVTAAVAANKGVWKGFDNPIRDALVKKLSSIGVEDSASIVNAVFANHSQAYTESLLGKAMDLASKPEESRKVIADMVNTAAYMTGNQTPADNLVTKLAKFGEPIKAQDTAKAVQPSASAKHNWRAAFSSYGN